MEQGTGTSSSGNTKADETGKKFRGWILTLWNKISIIEPEDVKAIYSVVGEEICPDTQKLHYHQFIYFKNPRTFSGIKKMTTSDAHIEIVRCNSDSMKYCKKDGKIIHEFGNPPNDNGVKKIRELVEESNSLTDLMEQDYEPYCK